MTSQITPEQKAEYEEAFCYFDRDHDGAIATSELGAVLKCLGQNPTEAELQSMSKEADKGGKGNIKLEDFMTLMSKMNKSSTSLDDLVNAFKFFDPTGSGLMLASDLKHAMKSIGEKLTDIEVQELLKGVPVDTQGKINYKNFLKSMIA